MRFEPGSNRYVPGGNKSCVEGQERRLEGDREDQRQQRAPPRRPTPAATQHDLARAPRLAAQPHAGDARPPRPRRSRGSRPGSARAPTRRACASARRSSSSGAVAVERGSNVAVEVDVGQERGRDPLDLRLRRAERIRHLVALLERRGEERVEQEQRAGEQDHDRQGQPEQRAPTGQGARSIVGSGRQVALPRRADHHRQEEARRC